MASPRTEVILAPTIDRQDLAEVKSRMNSAFDDVAKKSEKELEKRVGRGVSDGMKKGGDSGIKHLKTGLASLAVAAGAAAANALMGADEVINRMEMRLNTIRDIGKEAAAFSVSSGEYAQANAVFTSLGYDQSDVRGLLSGFQAELEEPEMAGYKKLADESGVLQSMLNFISSTRNMGQTERAAFLKPLGDEDSVIASAIAASMAKNDASSLQQLFTQMTGQSVTAEELTRKIDLGATESDALAKYEGGKYIQDILKGGNAEQVIKNSEMDRRLESAHDKNIEQKLIAKDAIITIEVATIQATQSTINGLEPWFENTKLVLSDMQGAIDETKKMGISGVLQYQPFSTDPNREKNEFLDFLTRGPFWDWLEQQQTSDTQQDYTNPRY
jgi:hypothetical protein